ncbi:unnamed protein product [Strongylus vulgaris]|uniref:TOG domain-containing protein n=1 Tax=Strongylus vulgaris TaxID=40348 RepID=A0A3P7JW49_STRVU|nr:unnamed protein product [Strongylus vulgaris]
MGERTKLEKIAEYCEEATKQNAEIMASRPKAAAVDKAGGDSLCSDGVVSAPLSDEPGDIDAWSLMEPTDVIAKMRKDFYELAASKKWQERKEAMESLLSVMESAPRVALSPDLQQVIVTLTKILEKDVNINVSSICVKVLRKLAESMRTDFAAMVPKLMPIAFDKLKEKKAVLRDELILLCDAASFTALLESYSEAICGGLTKPNPQSRAQTAQFTSRLFSRHSASTIPVEAVKQIVPELLKVLILEYADKIREEFGERASPEIIRLHESASNRQKASSSTETAPVRKAPSGPVKPLQSTGRAATRPLSGATSARSRVSTSASKSPNVMKAAPNHPPKAVTAQGRIPLTSRSLQPSASVKPSSSVKQNAAPYVPTQRRSTKPVFAPNVVRATTGSQVRSK